MQPTYGIRTYVHLALLRAQKGSAVVILHAASAVSAVPGCNMIVPVLWVHAGAMAVGAVAVGAVWLWVLAVKHCTTASANYEAIWKPSRTRNLLMLHILTFDSVLHQQLLFKIGITHGSLRLLFIEI